MWDCYANHHENHGVNHDGNRGVNFDANNPRKMRDENVSRNLDHIVVPKVVIGIMADDRVHCCDTADYNGYYHVHCQYDYDRRYWLHAVGMQGILRHYHCL